MRQRLAAVLFGLTCLTFPVAAQDLPALFHVVGVADNDVLNIRSTASAKSQIIGFFAPAEDQIEVITQDETGNWGLVNVGETSGWVSMRFLTASQPNDHGPSCFGTEPFWSAHALSQYQGRTLTFSLLGGPKETVPLIERRSRNDQMRESGSFTGQSLSGHYVISRQVCSDGMSDRVFGLTADFLINQNGEWTQYSGCCSLTSN